MTEVHYSLGRKRPNRPEQEIVERIKRAVERVDSGLDVRVYSGRQDANKRYGSARHNSGNTVDFYIERNGQRIQTHDPIHAQVVGQLPLSRINEIGVGMANGGIHAGFNSGPAAMWGYPGGTKLRLPNFPTHVAAVQAALGLTPDGVYGAQTMAALGALDVTAQQGNSQFAASQSPAPGTLANFWGREDFTTPPASVSPLGSLTMKQGTRGKNVESLQQTLEAAGYDPGPIDGNFGPQTKRAVHAYQVAVNRVRERAGVTPMAVDGIVGPLTREPLVETYDRLVTNAPPNYGPGDYGTAMPPSPVTIDEVRPRANPTLSEFGDPLSGLGLADIAPRSNPMAGYDPELASIRPRPNPIGDVSAQLGIPQAAPVDYDAASVVPSEIAQRSQIQSAPQIQGDVAANLGISDRSVSPVDSQYDEMLAPIRARAATRPYMNEPPNTFEDRVANLRQNMAAKNYQYSPDPAEQSEEEKAKETIRAQLREMQVSNQINAQAIGVDPSSLPTDAGTGGGVYRSTRTPDFDYAVGSSNAPIASAGGLYSAPRKETASGQGAISDAFDLSGALNFSPTERAQPATSRLSVNDTPVYGSRVGSSPYGPLQSRDVGYAPGKSPTSWAAQQTGSGVPSNMSDLAAWGANNALAYSPSNPLGASAASAVPAGEFSVTSPVSAKTPMYGLEPQQPDMKKLAAKGLLGLITGGPVGAALGVGTSLIGDALKGGAFAGNTARTGAQSGDVLSRNADGSFTRQSTYGGVERVSASGRESGGFSSASTQTGRERTSFGSFS